MPNGWDGRLGRLAGTRGSQAGGIAPALRAGAAALVAALLALASIGAANAQNATWTGDATGPFGGEWADPGNWSSHIVPTGTATFTSTAATTSVDVDSNPVIGTFFFTKNALPYDIRIEDFSGFTVTGAGVENTSSSKQLFVNFGSIQFLNRSTAGAAAIDSFRDVEFFNRSSAGGATITNGNAIDFADNSTAGNAAIINLGGSTDLIFSDNSTADHARIDNGGVVAFSQNSTAANAVIINKSGGRTLFGFNSTAGQAQLIANTGSTVDFSPTTGPLGDGRVSAGSIAGAGSFLLGANQLTVGGNNLSTSVSGSISDGFSGGSLVKIGIGTLRLSGNNAYTGGTTVAEGTLLLGQPASIAGTGPNVLVNAGAVAAAGYPIDQNFLNRIAPASQGIVALADDSPNKLDFNAAGLSRVSLGALGAATLSGALTPAGHTYRLGGGGLLTVAAPLGGAASLVVNGNGLPGTLILTGPNSYSGGTIVVAGTLQGNSTSLQGNIVDNATVVFDQAARGAFAGSIAGGGSFVKANGGLLILDGDSAGFAGTALVEGGALQVGDFSHPGARLGGDVVVAGGAILSGHGAIGGSVANIGGSVMPGGSIGTLAIGGNYTQTAAGALVVEVSPRAASQLVVAGHASLAGALALAYDPGTYSPRTYTLVRAGGISGTFAAVTGRVPTAGLSQAILIDPTQVQLTLTGMAPGPIVVAPSDDTIYSAMTSVLILNAQRANAIVLDRLDERLGGINDAPSPVALATPAAPRLAASGNLAAVGALAALWPQATGRYGGWFRGIGSFGSLAGNATAPGFSADSGGFLAGLDRSLAPSWFAGAAAGYTHSGANEQSTGSGAIDTARLAFYGGGEWGPVALTATAGYAHDWIDTSRSLSGLGTAGEGHGGNEATAGAQVLRSFAFGEAVVAAKAGLQYLHLSENGFAEGGADGMDLSSGNRSADSLEPYVRLSAVREFVTAGGLAVAPVLRLGYAREVLSNSRAVTVTAIDGAAFLVEGVKPSRDMLTAGVGATVRARDDLLLFARYDALLPVGNTIDHTVSAGLRLRF